jgi:hypothetical protein
MPVRVPGTVTLPGRGAPVAAAMLLLLCPATVGAATPASGKLRDGQWDFAIMIEMNRSASGPPNRPMAYSHCLQKVDVRAISMPPESPCRTWDFVDKGGVATWKLSCDTRGTVMTGTGRVEYDQSRMDVKVEMSSEKPRGLTIVQTVKGKYAGACRFPDKAGAAPAMPLRKYPAE